jgi:hypothetical protein
MNESVVSSRTSKYFISVVYLNSLPVLPVLKQRGAFVLFIEASEEFVYICHFPLSKCNILDDPAEKALLYYSTKTRPLGQY